METKEQFDEYVKKYFAKKNLERQIEEDSVEYESPTKLPIQIGAFALLMLITLFSSFAITTAIRMIF